MASTSETGHAVNVANLNTLISRCIGYGTRYNPTNNLIKIPAMQGVHTASNNSLIGINNVKPAFDNAVNARQQIFLDMEKLGTRTSKKILNPNPDEPQQISASQQSFNQQIEHYNKFIQLIIANPNYQTNETELQAAQLQTFETQLRAANQLVIDKTTPYLNALQTRNTIMYAPKTGLFDIQKEAKKYVKSVKTITLAEFRQISGLKFTKPKKTQ